MAEKAVRLRIEGADAARAAAELERFLRRHWTTEPRLERVAAPGPGGAGGVVRGDPVAIATLVLTIPPAIIATLDLAARLKLKEKVDRLLAWLGERGADEDARFYLEVLGGVDVPLGGADSEEIVRTMAGTEAGG